MKIDLFVLIDELVIDGLTKAKYEAILRMNAHILGLQEVLDKIREAETAFLTDAVKLKELYTSVLSFGASRENLEDLLKYMNKKRGINRPLDSDFTRKAVLFQLVIRVFSVSLNPRPILSPILVVRLL